MRKQNVFQYGNAGGMATLKDICRQVYRECL